MNGYDWWDDADLLAEAEGSELTRGASHPDGFCFLAFSSQELAQLWFTKWRLREADLIPS